jgi:hypothetical protein
MAEKVYGSLAKTLFKKSYNMKEARERQNITMEDVEEFREIVKASKIVPKTMVDSQVLHCDICRCFD